jgi:hypothetical protein
VVAPREDRAQTDFARQSAAVLNAVGPLLFVPMLLFVVVCFSVETAIAVQHRIVVSPTLWLHHHPSGNAIGFFPELIVTPAACFVGATMLSVLLRRESFARDEPNAVVAVVAIARRLVHRAWRRALLALAAEAACAPRPARPVDRDIGDDILRQLFSALSLLPAGPPALVALDSDPSGRLGQPIHRAEASAIT